MRIYVFVSDQDPDIIRFASDKTGASFLGEQHSYPESLLGHCRRHQVTRSQTMVRRDG